MKNKWKSVFKTALLFFVLYTFLELLGDYMLIKESAFEPLKTPKFYIGRVLLSFLFAILFEFTFPMFLKKPVKK